MSENPFHLPTIPGRIHRITDMIHLLIFKCYFLRPNASAVKIEHKRNDNAFNQSVKNFMCRYLLAGVKTPTN